MRVKPGKPYPLGATWDGKGVNFALFSEHAKGVELCIFENPDAKQECHRIKLREWTDMVWHCYLEDTRPGLLYGYRVHGPYAPYEGHRFNPNKVLLDPYAKGIGRLTCWSDEMFGYQIGHPDQDLHMDERDNADVAPLGQIIDQSFTWGDDAPPAIPLHKTVIYELHVKGFTKLHPQIPERLRGTYTGLASEAAIEHLVDLGINAVELMPVHHFVQDRHLLENGLHNYWGYNSLGFFAPYPLYAEPANFSDSVRCFKMMVRSLHAAGIEVILDVVYNHTAEGNHLGPTFCYKGIDNASYYRLTSEPRYYFDYTGTGNTLNVRNPRVLQLTMDSLRYWVVEMHVDGFRFDLASTLARELHEVDKLSAFFDIIHQDPILSQVKLIAEPWDLGDGGYQVGNFPVGWAEWNGKYRDSVRRFWKGDGGTLSEFATRLSGSSDLYQHSGRRPYASINFITAHDGFTLHDLVSYNEKHNEANKEDNRDGSNDNNSWNCGVEGPTKDPEIRELRERQKRNFIATLMCSQGVPMLLHGDEMGRTQYGNNNAYCQDNELSWIDWNLTREQQELLDFTRRVVLIRRENPVLRRPRFFQDARIRDDSLKAVTWLDADAAEMTDEAWNAGYIRAFGMLLAGNAIDHVDENGERIVGDTLLILLNAHHETLLFALPEPGIDQQWQRILDTWESDPPLRFMRQGVRYELRARSMTIFRLRKRLMMEEQIDGTVITTALT